MEMTSEIDKQKMLIKNYENDEKNLKKELAPLEKQAKNKENEKAKVKRLRSRIAAQKGERNAMEEMLNSTKPLDDLKERKSELQRQNEEDQAIMQDENASSSEKEAAEARVEQRNDELARLQTQVEERERVRPLSERIKEVFKKYGVTVTAALVAAGATIGAVVGTITKSLKATGKALGKGFQNIGATLGSMLPKLIGSIVSFLCKTAGQVVSYLAEHIWLPILAAVTFVFEKYIKKRC